MTSQPVEQRGDFKEWNYTETHLPVGRVDEHNACVTALRAALAREAELQQKAVDVTNDYLRRHNDACDRYLEIIALKADVGRLRETVKFAIEWIDGLPLGVPCSRDDRMAAANQLLAALGQEEKS